MTTFVKTGSALLAFAMAFGLQAATVTSSVIGANALSAITATTAEAGEAGKLRRAARKLEKAQRALENGNIDRSERQLNKATRILKKVYGDNNGVVAGPGCDQPGVLC